ncbi:glutaredoxin domain-containing protein [Streptacidiphilus cavernicola]|uniref:Glutaredoxin domain-containing protein n=1 Tax=Streptacidiphilus cavernicola TaxID=3342716 RepID=A0ABV6VVC1_9ACTN
MNTAHTIILYARPGCPYCARLRRALRGRGLAFTETDIWSNPQAAAFVRSAANGNETVPTPTVAGHTMVNPSAAEALAAVRDHAPQLLPAARAPVRWRRLRLHRTATDRRTLP